MATRIPPDTFRGNSRRHGRRNYPDLLLMSRLQEEEFLQADTIDITTDRYLWLTVSECVDTIYISPEKIQVLGFVQRRVMWVKVIGDDGTADYYITPVTRMPQELLKQQPKPPARIRWKEVGF